MGEKITVNFEAIDGSYNDSDQTFVSGPIDIFAKVDRIIDLDNEEFMTAVNAKLAEDPNFSIIVFVENPTNGDNTYYRRGVYYKYNPETYSWGEVAIGSHIHENKDVLDGIKAPDNSLDDGNSNLVLQAVLDKDSQKYSYVFDNIKGLPAIPSDVQKIIDENKQYRNDYLDDIADSQYHYLDMGLEDLIKSKNAYEDGYNYSLGGTCQSLYNAISLFNKSLYLNKNDNKISVSMDSGSNRICKILNVTTEGRRETFENISFNPQTQYLAVSFNGEFVKKQDVKYIRGEDNSLTIYFSDNAKYLSGAYLNEKQGGNELFALIIENQDQVNGITIDDFLNSVRNSDLILDIKTATYRIGKAIQYGKQKDVPNLYLTFDKNGKYTWDNKLIPTATTKIVKKTFNYNDSNEEITRIEHTFENGKTVDSLRLSIKDVNIDALSDILVMFDNTFVNNCDFLPFENSLEVFIPINDALYYDESNETFNLTILILSNSAISVAEELAKNYVTKEDLMKAIYNGFDFDADGYVTKDELAAGYAKRNHTHSNYAPKIHNHDNEYATYDHKHSEYITLNKLKDYTTLAYFEKVIEALAKELDVDFAFFYKSEFVWKETDSQADITINDNLENIDANDYSNSIVSTLDGTYVSSLGWAAANSLDVNMSQVQYEPNFDPNSIPEEPDLFVSTIPLGNEEGGESSGGGSGIDIDLEEIYREFFRRAGYKSVPNGTFERVVSKEQIENNNVFYLTNFENEINTQYTKEEFLQEYKKSIFYDRDDKIISLPTNYQNKYPFYYKEGENKIRIETLDEDPYIFITTQGSILNNTKIHDEKDVYNCKFYIIDSSNSYIRNDEKTLGKLKDIQTLMPASGGSIVFPENISPETTIYKKIGNEEYEVVDLSNNNLNNYTSTDEYFIQVQENEENVYTLANIKYTPNIGCYYISEETYNYLKSLSPEDLAALDENSIKFVNFPKEYSEDKHFYFYDGKDNFSQSFNEYVLKKNRDNNNTTTSDVFVKYSEFKWYLNNVNTDLDIYIPKSNNYPELKEYRLDTTYVIKNDQLYYSSDTKNSLTFYVNDGLKNYLPSNKVYADVEEAVNFYNENRGDLPEAYSKVDLENILLCLIEKVNNNIDTTSNSKIQKDINVTENIGGYSAGDIISEGTTINNVLRKLFQGYKSAKDNFELNGKPNYIEIYLSNTSSDYSQYEYLEKNEIPVLNELVNNSAYFKINKVLSKAETNSPYTKYSISLKNINSGYFDEINGLNSIVQPYYKVENFNNYYLYDESSDSYEITFRFGFPSIEYRDNYNENTEIMNPIQIEKTVNFSFEKVILNIKIGGLPDREGDGDEETEIFESMYKNFKNTETKVYTVSKTIRNTNSGKDDQSNYITIRKQKNNGYKYSIFYDDNEITDTFTRAGDQTFGGTFYEIMYFAIPNWLQFDKFILELRIEKEED